MNDISLSTACAADDLAACVKMAAAGWKSAKPYRPGLAMKLLLKLAEKIHTGGLHAGHA